MQRPWGGNVNTYQRDSWGPVKREVMLKVDPAGPGGRGGGRFGFRGKGNQGPVSKQAWIIERLPLGDPVENVKEAGLVHPLALAVGHRKCGSLSEAGLGLTTGLLSWRLPGQNGNHISPDSLQARAPSSVLCGCAPMRFPRNLIGRATSISTSQRGKPRLREGSTWMQRQDVNLGSGLR